MPEGTGFVSGRIAWIGDGCIERSSGPSSSGPGFVPLVWVAGAGDKESGTYSRGGKRRGQIS